ncbi:MAG: hypothetical protein PHC85_00415 [Candidatus Pacebacteria bacterium]|nr:hypothetical protein [Candidatus Paceibacterota bacterium]
MQTLKQSFLSIVISLVLLAGVNLVFGWTAPSDEGFTISNNVPTGNVATPINIGSTSQYKTGAFGVGGLLRAYGLLQVSGGMKIDGFLSCASLSTDSSGNVTCTGGCTPNCTGKVCGSDGCGGSCGTCTSPATCDGSGQCVTPTYTYSCTSTTCGTCSEACGGTQTCTGSCQRNDGVIVSSSYCPGGTCTYSQSCGGGCTWQQYTLSCVEITTWDYCQYIGAIIGQSCGTSGQTCLRTSNYCSYEPVTYYADRLRCQ